MRKSARLLGWVFLAATIASLSQMEGRAEAQGISVLVEELGTRDGNRLNALESEPLGASECPTDGSSVTLRLLLGNVQVSQANMLIDVWEGQGCNELSTRADQNLGSCNHVPSASGTQRLNSANPQQVELSFEISDFVDCSELQNVDSTLTFNFLITTQVADQNTEVGNNYGVLRMRFDLTTPEGPTNVSGGAGDTAVDVSWGLPEGETTEQLDSFLVCTEVAACDEADPRGSVLIPGEPPTDTSNCSTRGVASRSARIRLAELGLDTEAPNNSAVVGIAVQDRAGNVGAVSTACLTRISTIGFCDQFALDNEGESCPNCAVSAEHSPALLAWLMFPVALILGGTRRRAKS